MSRSRAEHTTTYEPALSLIGMTAAAGVTVLLVQWLDLSPVWFLFLIPACFTAVRLTYSSLYDLFPLNHPAYRQLTVPGDRIYLLLDRSGRRVRFSSPGAAEYFPGLAEDRPGKIWHSAFETEDREILLETLAGIQTGTPRAEHELRLILPDGSEAWLSVQLSEIRDSFGRLRRIALICEDISLLRESRLKLVKAREYEVEVGARIQQSLLLGKPLPGYRGMQIGAFTLPSQKIDGDFIDFFSSMQSEETDFVLGDVMGKGVPAALMGAAARNELMRSRFRIGEQEPATLPALSSILEEAEHNIASQLQKLNSFVTLIYGRIDRQRRLMSFIDCGHTSMIHYDASGGRCWLLKGADMPLGFVAVQSFREYAVGLGKGDILFLYSDGITEAVNGEAEQFGEERLMHLIRSSAELDAEVLLEKVKQITFAYCAGSFNDDVTGIAIKIDSIEDEETVQSRRQEFPRQLSSVRSIREFLFTAAHESMSRNKTDPFSSEIELAVAEAVTNIIRHQDSENSTALQVEYRCTADWISISLEYQGDDYNWQDIPNPDVATYQENGYGLFLMTTAMDSVLLQQGEGRNLRLMMIKYTGRERGKADGISADQAG